MRSRQLNKRIDIYQIERVSDGFGGYVNTESLLSKSWAKMSSITAGKAKNLLDFGIDDPQKSVEVTVRRRNDLNYQSGVHFFKYAGDKYVIISDPTDVDFNHTWVKFIAKRVEYAAN